MENEVQKVNLRYCAVFGFNSKQWWVYDSVTNEWCDPPISVLEEIGDIEDPDECEARLEELANAPNDWINNVDYRFDADMTDI